jgi:hypothetical protein
MASMQSTVISSADILQDLENIYTRALAKGNLAVALKVKELLGRECGLFSLKNRLSKKANVSLDTLSEEDVQRLISEIEQQLTLDA